MISQTENVVQCSTESEDDKADGIMRRWLERYANAQVPTKDIIKRVDAKARKQVKLRQQCTKDSDPSMSFRLRSLQNKKRRSTGDDNLFRCSPMFPTYMAATGVCEGEIKVN
ncbi:hypothetical protein Nepgr_021210 [Nepenthes gracilis]|uniref:Uncharacterized protein n=1 Tax=Nepenthes gracilis TaxID=150966 RepID=A0AAD3SZ55_NEPGR|nr:hypothetical protein Nepgr_021210 [Nepenthes gracilis]